MSPTQNRLDDGGLWRRGLRRLAGWLRGPATTTDRPGYDNRPVEEHAVEDFTLVTPAQGEAWAFWIDVHIEWCAKGTVGGDRPEDAVRGDLRAEIRALQEDARRRVENVVRPIARRHLPDRPGDLEAELGPTTIHCLSDGRVRATTTARVFVVEPVRKELERYSLQRLALDQRRDHTLHLIAVLAELRDAWRGFLDQGFAELSSPELRDKGWRVPYAVALAERPEKVAEVMHSMLAERLQEADKLFDRLGGMVQDSQHVDVYDFIVKSDVALRQTLQALGVDVPELEYPHPEAPSIDLRDKADHQDRP